VHSDNIKYLGFPSLCRPDFRCLVAQVCNALIETTKPIKGAKVEHNKFCVTVHFRRVKEEVRCLNVYDLTITESLDFMNACCTALS
jgi:trehalose-6-phosphatase